MARLWLGIGLVVAILAARSMRVMRAPERHHGVPSAPAKPDHVAEQALTAPTSSSGARPEAGAPPLSAEPLASAPRVELGHAAIRIRVLSRVDRQPIAGARVEPIEPPGPALTTDAEGACSLDVSEKLPTFPVPVAGSVPVIHEVVGLLVTSEGHVHGRGRYLLQPEIEVLLGPAIAMQGRVLDARGAAVSDARIAFDCEHDDCEVGSTRSGEGGRYRLSGLPSGARMFPQGFTVRASGHPTLEEMLDLSGQPDGLEHDFRLAAGVRLSGHVREWGSAAPIADARVHFRNETATTAADGSFALAFARDGGESPLSVWSREHCHLLVTLEEEELRSAEPLELLLVRFAAVEGIVRDPGGNPVPGAQGFLAPDQEARRADREARHPFADLPSGWKMTELASGWSTDESGVFRVQGLVPWTRHWMVRTSSGKASVRIPVLPGPGETIRVELVGEAPRATGAIEGSLTLAGTRVQSTLHWKTGAQSGSRRASGEYRIPDLEPGLVRLSFELPRFPGLFREREDAVVVRAGETTRHDLDLQLATLPVSGTVVHDDGSPAGGVELVLGSGPQVPIASMPWVDRLRVQTRSGPDGTFELACPDLGLPCRVEASVCGRLIGADVRAPATGVRLVVPRAGLLRVRIVDDETGAPVSRWEAELAWKPAREEGFRPFRVGWPGSAPAPDGFLAVPAAREPLDLLVDGSRLGYRRLRVDGVLPGTPQEPAQLELRLVRGLRASFLLVGDERPPARAQIYLVEPEAWGTVRGTWEEGSPGFTSSQTDGGPFFPGLVFLERALRFDKENEDSVDGLAPGPYRFQVVNATGSLVPESIEVTPSSTGPFELRWRP